MKQLGLIFLSLLTLGHLQAAALPTDHFLAPRDYEVMWISGIESPMTASGLRRAATNCSEGPAPFEVCTWMSEIENAHIEELNLERIIKAEDQVIFFGERHLNNDVQEKMAELILSLPNGHTQALALEMINAKDQTVVDAYLEDEISREEMEVAFKKGWNYESSGYMKMIEAAKNKKLKIIALDDRPGHSDANFSDNLLGRDKQMASVLDNYLELNPDHRIIVYSGKLHAFKTLSLDGNTKTIADNLKVEHPNLKTSHYFIFGKKESSLLRESLKALKLPTTNALIKTEALSPYIDGTIFLNW